MPKSCELEPGKILIHLRKTNTSIIREYIGYVETLEQPIVVQRAGREIKYYKRPKVTFVRSFVYTGKVRDDEEEEE
jgi:hypothetical protein